MESYEREISLVGHTGRLPSVRKPSLPLMLMSGPLYVTNGTENPLKHTIVVEGNKVVESKTEKFCNLSEKDENHCNNNYDRKNEHLVRSRLLGICNDPYCITCPTYFKTSMQRLPNDSTVFDPQFHFHSALYGDARVLVEKVLSFCSSCVPGVMNPHSKVVQQWNKLLAIFCMGAYLILNVIRAYLARGLLPLFIICPMDLKLR